MDGAVNPFVYITLEQRANISYLREHSFPLLTLLLDTNIAVVFARKVAVFVGLCGNEGSNRILM